MPLRSESCYVFLCDLLLVGLDDVRKSLTIIGKSEDEVGRTENIETCRLSDNDFLERIHSVFVTNLENHALVQFFLFRRKMGMRYHNGLCCLGNLRTKRLISHNASQQYGSSKYSFPSLYLISGFTHLRTRS
jgi:hypothetical protein